MNSCNYPILHTFNVTNVNDSIKYSIYIGSTEIYRGSLAAFDTTSGTIQIDIKPVCCTYLDTFYENLAFGNQFSGPVPSNGLYSTIHTFTVESPNNTINTEGEDYVVCYDYNTDYKNRTEYNDILADSRTFNMPLKPEADIRQYLFVSGVGNSFSFSYTINGTNYPVSGTAIGNNYGVGYIKLDSTVAEPGDEITTLLNTGGEVQKLAYKIVPGCRNKFAVYYVNKAGGFDSIVCTGKHTISWSPNRVDVRLYNNKTSTIEWGQKRIQSEQEYIIQLNTGFIPIDRVHLIDNLIYSPKILVHDLEEDVIFSAVITTGDMSQINPRYNRPNYTFNVKCSQTQLRL